MGARSKKAQEAADKQMTLMDVEAKPQEKANRNMTAHGTQAPTSEYIRFRGLSTTLPCCIEVSTPKRVSVRTPWMRKDGKPMVLDVYRKKKAVKGGYVWEWCINEEGWGR